MLTTDMLDAFVQRDTAVVCDTLIGHSLLDTPVGDRVLAAIGNYPARATALHRMLTDRGIGDV